LTGNFPWIFTKTLPHTGAFSCRWALQRWGDKRICDVEHEQQDPLKKGMSAISAGIWQEFLENMGYSSEKSDLGRILSKSGGTQT